MSQEHAEEHDIERTATLLHEQGYEHLRARKYGRAVIIESGPSEDPIKHFRLRRESTHRWQLDFADHRGKWEATPFEGKVGELVTTIVKEFPWTIQKLD